jgi:hypothetical protein
MKYLKLYEDIKTYNDFNKLITDVRAKLNIIGLNINFIEGPIERMRDNKYTMRIDCNINGIKGSFLSIFSKNMLHKYKEDLDNKIYIVTDNDNVLNTKVIKNIDVDLDINKKIDDIYITIMNNISNGISEAGNAIKLDKKISNMRDFLTSFMISSLKVFIKDNTYYEINNVNISEEFLEKLFNTINYLDNKYSVINDLKNDQPLIYKKLVSKFGDQIDKSAGMGNMGYGDD